MTNLTNQLLIDYTKNWWEKFHNQVNYCILSCIKKNRFREYANDTVINGYRPLTQIYKRHLEVKTQSSSIGQTQHVHVLPLFPSNLKIMQNQLNRLPNICHWNLVLTINIKTLTWDNQWWRTILWTDRWLFGRVKLFFIFYLNPPLVSTSWSEELLKVHKRT